MSTTDLSRREPVDSSSANSRSRVALRTKVLGYSESIDDGAPTAYWLSLPLEPDGEGLRKVRQSNIESIIKVLRTSIIWLLEGSEIMEEANFSGGKALAIAQVQIFLL